MLPDENGEALAVITHKAVEDRGRRVLERHLIWRGGVLEILQTESKGPQGVKLVHRELPVGRSGGRTWLVEVKDKGKMLHFESHCFGAPPDREQAVSRRPIGAAGLTEILAAGARPLDEIWLLQPSSATVEGIRLRSFNPAHDPLVVSAAKSACEVAGIEFSGERLRGFEWVARGGRILRRQVFCSGELLLFQWEGRASWARRIGAKQADRWKRGWASKGLARTGLVMGAGSRNASSLAPRPNK